MADAGLVGPILDGSLLVAAHQIDLNALLAQTVHGLAGVGLELFARLGRQVGRLREVEVGAGMVSVPVLSVTRASTLRSSSRAVASLTSICCWAALPILTISAVGVARPIAQGQAMTSTATAERMAWGRREVPPRIHQLRNVTREIRATVGTKRRAARSTMRCTGGLLLCAASTMRMMWGEGGSLAYLARPHAELALRGNRACEHLRPCLLLGGGLARP